VALKGNVEAGLFHGVYKLVNGLGFIAEAVAQTVYPMISRQIDSGEAHFTYELTIKYLVIISLPLVIAFGFFAEPLIGLILGGRFLSAAPTMRFLGAALLPLFLSNLMERMLIAHNRQQASSLLTAASVVVLVIFDVSLIPSLGAFGAGVATLIGEAALVILYHVYIRRRVDGHEVFRSALKPLAAALVACLAIYLSLGASVLVQAAAGLFAYLGTLLLLGTFSAAEVGVIRESLRRRPGRVGAPRRL
jgi:O-antigen/teichoic acid export membrane protein